MNRSLFSDFTFLFPIRIDSMDRYENLNVAIHYMKHFLEAHVLILEADDFQHINPNTLPGDVDYHFIKDSRSKFHRTHYINELIKKASTPYVGIWDVDVLIPITQLEEALQRLKKHECFCILPYDGRCYSLNREEKQSLKTSMQLDTGMGVIYAEHACGGALMVNKKAFIQAGMCNEHLTGWGPDDVEQKKRLEILGHPLPVIHGPLFHLFHIRSINSDYQGDQDRIKLMEEYIRIASMNNKELQDYIKSWPWIQGLTEEKEHKINIPEEELCNLLDRKDADSGLKLTSEVIGWLHLGQKGNHPRYREKISDSLKVFIEKIRKEEDLSAEDLSEIGLILLIVLKKQLLPSHYRTYLNNIDASLFTILYKKRLQSLEFENGVWRIILYFRELLLSPQEYHIYNPIYYKEYLIYVIDETYRLLKKDYQLKKESIGTLSQKDKKNLALSLWTCHLLSDMELNQVVSAQITAKLACRIQEYFTQTSARETEDLWLLYVWYKVKSKKPHDKLRFHQWFSDWEQNKRPSELTTPENYLYRECCRICDEQPSAKSYAGDIDSAIAISMLQNEISDSHESRRP